MKINQEEYTHGERVNINAELDDGDGWYWKIKNKKGTVIFDEYGMHIKTDEGDKVYPIDLSKIIKLTPHQDR